ncbi:MAG: thioredoxin family protein [Oscillospiraceae bacterium]|nr:thioredoxin family protein [Oscillospiraceae bacterium]
MIIELNRENFSKEVQKNAPILVDFWATWCPPCMKQGQVLHALAEEYPELRIGKVNVDENPELAAAFGISNIPTMMMFRSGQASDTVVGLRNASQVLDMFRQQGVNFE